MLTCSGVVDGVVFVVGEAGDLEAFDDQRREGDVAFVEDGQAVLVRHGLVHQRVVADEVEHRICQRKVVH